MHDYHLEELGPRGFEQLATALASAEFGSGVEVYGSGTDGGREATLQGIIQWSASGGKDWNGYTVVQAKQREHPSWPAENLEWLKRQIYNELNSWMSPESKRSRFPNYILFVTNVRLSATDTSGGVDQINAFSTDQIYREHDGDSRRNTPHKRGLREIKIWHRDSLNAIISKHQSIRSAFPAILTVGDILDRLRTLQGSLDPDGFASVLRSHAQSSLRYGRWVRFGEAGGHSSRSIEQVIVNLPAINTEQRRIWALNWCLKQGDVNLRRSLSPKSTPRHVVITGAPGNGKSTLVSYLTQVYLSQFAQAEQHSQTISTLISETNKSLQRLSLTPPKSTRWPFRISLPDMANDMGPTGGPSLKRWMAQQISKRASIDVQPATLEGWINAWPTVILLDGFDEVTAPALRTRIVDEITELVEDADSADADLFVITTTRPTGYTERLLPEHFAQIDLDYLTKSEAIAYGQHVTTQRLHEDLEQSERILSRFTKAASDPSTERLLKTPLQVLILTFILEGMGDLPANRYDLFWGYYDTIYRREAEKNTTIQSFLREHRDDITEIHERVGLTLHTQSEGTAETHSRLPRTYLRKLALERLIEVGHEDTRTANELADRILDIATTRLVLLAADQNETVSFDIRSLQELMAARALVNGDDTVIRRNLTSTASSPHWRNMWLFAAGKLFTETDHRRNLVLEIVENYDATGEWPGWLYPVGPELAAHLLDDGLAATKPAAQKRLVEVALRSLNGPMPNEPRAVAQGLSYAMTSKTLAARIRNALKSAFSSTPTAIAIAATLRNEGDLGGRVPGEPDEIRYLSDMWQLVPKTGQRVRLGRLLEDPLGALRSGDDIAGADLVEAALDECDSIILRKTPDGDLWPVPPRPSSKFPHLRKVLADQEASTVLELCLGALQPSEWAAQSHLARVMWAMLSRDPVSHQLTPSYLRGSDIQAG